MEDIEDLILSEDYFESALRMQRDCVVPKVRQRNKRNQKTSEEVVPNGNCSYDPKNNSENCCKSSFSVATSCEPDLETSVISCIENPSSQSNLHHTEPEKNGLSNSVCHSSHCCNGTVSLDDLSRSHSKTEEEQESRKSFEVAHNLSNDCISSIKLDTFLGSNIPGLARVYVHTWGCAHNSSDSEYMAGQLAAYGYDIVENKEEAELWLLNSCTVKSPAEHHLRNEINTALSLGKKVVVAGCVSQGAPRSEFLAGLSIVGVQQIDRVVEVVEETLNGNSVRLLGTKKKGGKKQGGASLQLPKIRRNPLIEIISINTGCLNQCTYCKTKHARGQLGSYPIEDLVSRAEQSFHEGVVEVWLTSEDTGAYGLDIGTTLPELLRRLMQAIPPGCKLRLGMTNPPYILDHLEDMADILNDPRVYKFLHVPVQSGSDNVLWDMKREYTCEQFFTVVDTLRERVPGLTIATDIICGYPTESEEDFEATMALCRRYRFPSLFINQYFPRPGTPAARLPRIHPRLVKERTKKLSDFFQSYSPYDHKLNETQSILVTEESHDKRHWVGHNDYYEQVLVPKEADYLGKTLRVIITETGKHFLKGRVLVDEERGDGGLVTPALCVPLPKGAVSGVAQSLSTTSGGQSKHGRPCAVELGKQETYIIVSFVVLITALIARLAWICWRMADT